MKDVKVVKISDTATNGCRFEFGLGDRIQLKTGAGGSGIVRDGQCEITGQVQRIIYLVEADSGFFYLACQEEIKPEGG
ncbi:MAG: hypothetical protein ACREA4_13810 [Nitrososphaera sp.]